MHIRFPHPDSKGYDNTAYVAVHFGFEVQIDHLARPEGAGVHKTGAVYGLAAPADPDGLPVRAVGEWNEFEITARAQTYDVWLNGVHMTHFVNEDPARGHDVPSFVGLQRHTGRVAFRNVRIMPAGHFPPRGDPFAREHGAMSTQQWWYEQGGQPKGPLGSDEIRSMVETGVLVRSSRIIVVGGSEWGTVEDHASELGLHSAAPAPAPAPGPGPAAAAGSGPGGDGGPGTATSAPPGPSSAPPSQAGAPAAVAYSAPAYQPGPAGSPPIVSNGKRFGAWLLDALLLIVTLFIGWIIWMFVILGKGQTPAKQLLGMRVVDMNTRRVPSYGTMALRVLVYQWLLGNVTAGITTIVGGVMILMDKELHQGLWDKMANTVVVDDPDGRAL